MHISCAAEEVRHHRPFRGRIKFARITFCEAICDLFSLLAGKDSRNFHFFQMSFMNLNCVYLANDASRHHRSRISHFFSQRSHRSQWNQVEFEGFLSKWMTTAVIKVSKMFETKRQINFLCFEDFPCWASISLFITLKPFHSSRNPPCWRKKNCFYFAKLSARFMLTQKIFCCCPLESH